MAERPRAALVATCWPASSAGSSGAPATWSPEAAWATRRVAAALAMEADVHAVVLDGGATSSPCPDGAFTVARLASRRPDAARHEALLGALSACRAGSVPPDAQRELRRLAGGGPVVELLDHLGALRPDAVVVAGFTHEAAAAVVRALGASTRVAVLALALDDIRLGLPIYEPVLLGADVLLATNAWEQRLLSARLGASTVPVVDLGVTVEPTRPEPAPPEPAAAGNCRGELLVLAPGGGQRPGVARAVAADLAVVAARAGEEGVALRRAGPPAGALATIDLRPPGPLGAAVLESMAAGVPAIVPAYPRTGAPDAGRRDHAARGHLEEGGGGLWYRDPAELSAAVGRLIDPSLGATLSVQGATWAARRHGNRAAFVEAVCSAVLGPPAGRVMSAGLQVRS